MNSFRVRKGLFIDMYGDEYTNKNDRMLVIVIFAIATLSRI